MNKTSFHCMNVERTVGRYQEQLSAQTPAGHLGLQMDLCVNTHNKQVLLKVIWEEHVAPRWIKRVANYWGRTALACCHHSKRVYPSKIRLAYASVCRCMLYHSKMSACYSYSLHGRIATLRLFCCVFALEFLFNPQFVLEPDYIIRKPLLHKIQRYILRREILSTFHTRVDNRSICHFCIVFTPKLPLPLRQSPPKSNTPTPSPTPLTTPNGIPIQSPVSPLITCADGQMGQAKALSHERFALWSDALIIATSSSSSHSSTGTVRFRRRSCRFYM